MTERPTAETFLPHVDKTFRVVGGRHALTLKNIDVGHREERERKVLPFQPFNLIFSGPPGDVLAEGLYTLEVDGGPSFELYVMPIHTPERDRQDYQSLFN
jgi:hypothetical protein